jgi:hypothetical protein
MVGAEGRNYCRPVCRHAVARRGLDCCPALDGDRVHFKCEALWTHTLPLYRALLLSDDASSSCFGFHLIPASIYAWLAPTLLIICGGWVIWWTTRTALGQVLERLMSVFGT